MKVYQSLVLLVLIGASLQKAEVCKWVNNKYIIFEDHANDDGVVQKATEIDANEKACWVNSAFFDSIGAEDHVVSFAAYDANAHWEYVMGTAINACKFNGVTYSDDPKTNAKGTHYLDKCKVDVVFSDMFDDAHTHRRRRII